MSKRLKSTRSVPIISNNENLKLMEKTVTSLSNIKSVVGVNNRTAAEESQQHLDTLNRIVNETDNNLRRALEHATIRHEQLDELQIRSQEMLNKNENLIFGITNYRKTQERDLCWRRFQYTAFGTITIGVIILLIILSMTSKRPTSSPQIIDIRHSNQDLLNKNNTDITLSKSRKRRRRKREIII